MAERRRTAAAMLTVALVTGSLAGPAMMPSAATASVPPFTDTVGHPFALDIEWLRQSGITAGCAPERFCPDNTVSREQMASFLARALGLPPGADFFTDDESSVHEGDINRLAAAGITWGCAPTSFCPAASVSREQMASFLVRAFGLAPTTADQFGDDDASPHQADINALAVSGITSGCGGGRFCPAQAVTRGQMAAFLRRALHPEPPSAACSRTATAPTNGADATSGLNADIAATPNGGTLCLVAGATYRVSGTWLVQSRANLTINGNGAVVQRLSENSSTILQLQLGTGITVRNLVIDGSSTQSGVWRYNLEGGHGIRFGGATGVLLDGVTIRNVTGDGLYIAGGCGTPICPADNVTVRNSLIDGTGRNGVSITDGGNNVLIQNNTFRDIGYYTFDIEPNGYGVGAAGVDFVDNVIGPNGYAYIHNVVHGFVMAITGSSGGGPAIDIDFSRNTLLGQPFRVGVYNNGGARQLIRVADNHSDTRSTGQVELPLLFFGGVSGLTVTNNIGFSNAEVSTSGSSSVVISGNQ
jgi:hypothetical protein